MRDPILIRAVTVELLRPGPAHNQLLSPLTQYLGICDDGEAGVVTQPYEHMSFLERMRAMRYDDGGDAGWRRPAMRELGREVARVLGSVSRLPGSLTSDPAGAHTLVHLRLVLSASELAALPFELAKVPIGPTSCTEAWLSLQARTPVVITRRTRNVSAEGTKWPLRPRILFVAASPDDVPFDEHRRELIDALQPFLAPGRDDPQVSADGRREQFGALLTMVKDARLEDVAAECAANDYTHVHVLAHGAGDADSVHASYCLLLGNELVSAERLASALTVLRVDAVRRPSVVTLATCDSGNVGSVLVPTSSIAHVLHQAGIVLVLASQVPLSKEGSVLVVRELYRGLLWAENPWVLLHRLRTALHRRLGEDSHDWASLVVYEALPRDLAEQLEEARYLQARTANNVAFERLDLAAAASGRHDGEKAALQEPLRRLPTAGRFAVEGLGLRASILKRLAQAEFNTALQPDCADRDWHATESARCLHESARFYEQAVSGFLVDAGRPAQRVATLHWVLVQQLSLSAVLGLSVAEGTLEMAQLSARAHLDLPDPEVQAWAHGSLAELALLSLQRLPPGSVGTEPFERLRGQAHGHVRELIRLARRIDRPFIVESTLRQFRRYADWWGTPLMQDAVMGLQPDARGSRQPDGDGAWAHNAMVSVAHELAALLDASAAAGRARPAAAAALPSAPVAPAPAAGATHAAAAEQAIGGTAAAATGLLTTAPRAHRGAADGAFIHIEMLPAGHGDCLWIEYGQGGKTSRVLVDGGTPETFEPLLRPRIEKLPRDQRHLDLLLLTHIDADHIGGATPLVKAADGLGLSVADVWFNGWKHIKRFGFLGARQGEVFSALLTQHGWPWNAWQGGRTIVLPADGPLPTATLPGGMVLTLLSPGADKLKALALKWKKDITALGLEPGQGDAFLRRTTVSTSEDVEALAASRFTPDAAQNNGSSITVLAEYGGKSVLLGADCHAPLLAASIKSLLRQRGLKKLALDAFKVPHHGSRNNLDNTLLGLLDCRNYLISTSGKVFGHPDREAIARIIRHGGASPTLWFNYRSAFNEVWSRPELQSRYGYRAVYPDPGHEGLRVVI